MKCNMQRRTPETHLLAINFNLQNERDPRQAVAATGTGGGGSHKRHLANAVALAGRWETRDKERGEIDRGRT